MGDSDIFSKYVSDAGSSSSSPSTATGGQARPYTRETPIKQEEYIKLVQDLMSMRREDIPLLFDTKFLFLPNNDKNKNAEFTNALLYDIAKKQTFSFRDIIIQDVNICAMKKYADATDKNIYNPVLRAFKSRNEEIFEAIKFHTDLIKEQFIAFAVKHPDAPALKRQCTRIGPFWKANDESHYTVLTPILSSYNDPKEGIKPVDDPLLTFKFQEKRDKGVRTGKFATALIRAKYNGERPLEYRFSDLKALNTPEDLEKITKETMCEFFPNSGGHALIKMRYTISMSSKATMSIRSDIQDKIVFSEGGDNVDILEFVKDASAYEHDLD